MTDRHGYPGGQGNLTPDLYPGQPAGDGACDTPVTPPYTQSRPRSSGVQIQLVTRDGTRSADPPHGEP